MAGGEASLQECLRKAILAYQSILQGTGAAIKEATWEFLLAEAARASGESTTWSVGSHKPGGDVVIGETNLSCKTCKMERGLLKISSYRLTRVCTTDTPDDLIHEIDEKRNDFQEYCVLARTMVGPRVTGYRVYRIPSARLKAGALSWRKEPNGNWTGTGEEFTMSILKSMSYQLWMNVPMDYIADCIWLDIPMASVKPMSIVDLYDIIYPAVTPAAAVEPEVTPEPAGAASPEGTPGDTKGMEELTELFGKL